MEDEWEQVAFFDIVAYLFCSFNRCDHTTHSDEVVVKYDRQDQSYWVKEMPK